jgi:hypothetical protein
MAGVLSLAHYSYPSTAFTKCQCHVQNLHTPSRQEHSQVTLSRPINNYGQGIRQHSALYWMGVCGNTSCCARQHDAHHGNQMHPSYFDKGANNADFVCSLSAWLWTTQIMQEHHLVALCIPGCSGAWHARHGVV